MAGSVSRDTLVFRRNLGERISYCVDKIGKKSDAAASSGISSEQLNKWISGTVKVPVEALRLLSVAANVDFSWLATGDGDAPAMGPVQIGLENPGRQRLWPTEGPHDIVRRTQHEAPADADFVSLPCFDIQASAGLGVPVGPEVKVGAIAFDRGFLRLHGAKPEQCSIITASGDSMQPAIPDGSLLVVDHSQTEVKNGHIMVINVGDDLLVKRIRRRLDGVIELLSDNPSYAPEAIGPDMLQQLRIVGRVVYFCRTP